MQVNWLTRSLKASLPVHLFIYSPLQAIAPLRFKGSVFLCADIATKGAH